MAIVTKAELARIAVVNRSSINKAITAGHLVVRPDGKLDTDNPVNQDYIKRCKDKRAQPKPTTEVISSSKSTPKTKKVKDLNGFNGEIPDNQLSLLDYSSVNKIKVIEQIQKLRVETKKNRMELVDKRLVGKVFSKLYMIDVNMWRTLGANLSPEIASIAKIDDNEIIIKVGEVIEKEVFVILGHVKRIMNDFLIDIEANEID